MTAVDTNVVVRLLTGDDPAQEAAARALFESGPIWIAKTVLLEAFDKSLVRRAARAGVSAISAVGSSLR